MEFLTWPTGLIAGGIAVPLLVLMYFLKLRRSEVPVSCTLLWKQAVQDLQVNAPFQKLRRNILLLLQLICLILICLALMGIMWFRKSGAGKRYVILIDRSASMRAADVEPTRLDEAKRQATEFVDELRRPSMFGFAEEGDKAMIMAFDDRAKVLCKFTDDKRRLAEAIDSIRGTDGKSSLAEAVAVARAFAQGAGEETNNRSAMARAQLVLFSDGRINDAEGITIEEGEVVFHRIGTSGDNVAVVAMQARRSFEKVDEVTIFATLANYGDTKVTHDIQLSIDGDIRAVREVEIPPRTLADGDRPANPGKTSLSFSLTHTAGAVIEVRKIGPDDLTADDAAWAVLPPPKRLSVLLVSADNPALEKVLKACPLGKLAVKTPSEFDAMDQDALGAGYDVIVLDRYCPEKMPRGRFLIFGEIPRWLGVTVGAEIKSQTIVDWRSRHPVLQHVDLSNLFVIKANKLTLPRDAVVLAEFSESPAIAMISRKGGTYLLTGFDVMGSNWPFEVSFVVFCYNATKFLGMELAQEDHASLAVGQAIEVRTGSSDKPGRVLGPGRDPVEVRPDSSGTLRFPQTDRAGLYTVEVAGRPAETFAVNILDELESDIAPRGDITFSGKAVQAVSEASGKSDQEIWPYLAAFALLVVCVEWFVYNSKLRL